MSYNKQLQKFQFYNTCKMGAAPLLWDFVMDVVARGSFDTP